MIKYDVVVIGAGIIGCASAYHLKLQCPSLKIMLIDKEAAVGQGNTAQSAACFRNTFSSSENQILTDSSINFYLKTHIDLLSQQRSDIFSNGLDILLNGYLWLLDEEMLGRIEPVINRMKDKGIEIEIIDKKQILNLKGICTDSSNDEDAKIMGLRNIDFGLLGKKCGALDPDRLTRYYLEEFKKLGGKVMLSSHGTIRVSPKDKILDEWDFAWQEKEVSGIVVNDSKTIQSNLYILCTGTWTNNLLHQIGLDSLTEPKKRQLFSIEANTDRLRELLFSRGFNEEGIAPFTILPKAGVYIKPNPTEMTFWVGCADNLGRKFYFEESPTAEDNYYHGIYLLLHKYFPEFENKRYRNKWAGLYSYNNIDYQPVIFRENNLVVSCGTSGSGIMKADAIGRIVTAIAQEEEYASLFGDIYIETKKFGKKHRNIEEETFII